jgi:hypothetical protein
MDHAPQVITDWMVLLIKSVVEAYGVPVEQYVYGETDISCPAGILERMFLECQNIFCPDIPFIYSMSKTIEDIWIPEMQRLLTAEDADYLSDVKEEEKQAVRATRDAMWDELVRRRTHEGNGTRPYTQEEREIIKSILDHPTFAFDKLPYCKLFLGKRVKRSRNRRMKKSKKHLDKRKKSITIKRKKSIKKHRFRRRVTRMK